ncbi:MAG: TetR/AcrR family transcriptional regulator [Phototrophicaceae bacterium]
MKTKDRIITIALDLFNREGVAQVSTNHIAEAVGISPGNLYYHFRNKEDIIRAICSQLFTRTGEMFQPPTDRLPTLEDVQAWVKANFEVTWEYAFVYRELPALLQQDAELASLYRATRQRGYSGFRHLITLLQEAHVLTPDLNETTIDYLADLFWLVTESWLTALQLQGLAPTEDNMQRGVEVMSLILQPYLL